MPLYVAGAKVSEIYAVIPISDGHAIAIGVLTYRDAVHFAAYVDPLLPIASEFDPLFRDAVAELEHAVAAAPVASRSHNSARGPVEATAGARI